MAREETAAGLWQRERDDSEMRWKRREAGGEGLFEKLSKGKSVS
jgi:hypothetical protein